MLVGVGGVPNIEIADNTKIEIDNGIKVDNACRTNVEDIYAIGDCTNHWNNIYKRYIRLESVQNAIDQAKVVAENISSGDASYDSVPWFWSDQYDIKLQIAGVSQNFDEVIIVVPNEWKNKILKEIQNRLSGWQLETFKTSYENKKKKKKI